MGPKNRDDAAVGRLDGAIPRDLPGGASAASDGDAVLARRRELRLVGRSAAAASPPVGVVGSRTALDAFRRRAGLEAICRRAAGEPFCWLPGRFKVTRELGGTTLRSERGRLLARARGPFVVVEPRARVPAETIEVFRALVERLRSA